ALEHYRQAHDILSALVRDHPAVPQYQASLASNQCQLAKMYMNSGQLEAAEQNYQAALAVQQVVAHDRPDDFISQRKLASTYMLLGALHTFRLSQAREADVAVREALARSCEDAYQKAAALFEDLARRHAADPESRYLLGRVHICLVNLH